MAQQHRWQPAPAGACGPPPAGREFLIARVGGKGLVGKRGTIFRVIEGGKVKELVFPGRQETSLGYVGRADRDSVPWAFARRGKRYVILQGRGDHGDQPPADTYFAVELGAMKVVQSTPMVESEVVNDQGYVLAKTGKVLDLTQGKAAVTLAADLTWRGLTDAHALAWSAPAGTLTLTPLAGGAAKKVPLAGEVTFTPLRHGDVVVMLVEQDGKTAVKLLDAARALTTDVAVHEGETKLLIASERVVEGQVWLLVQEKTPEGLRVHIHAAPAP